MATINIGKLKKCPNITGKYRQRCNTLVPKNQKWCNSCSTSPLETREAREIKRKLNKIKCTYCNNTIERRGSFGTCIDCVKKRLENWHYQHESTL